MMKDDDSYDCRQCGPGLLDWTMDLLRDFICGCQHVWTNTVEILYKDDIYMEMM